MKLTYWKQKPNFGDALNPWIFNELAPGFFDNNDREAFLGIGTVLGWKFPSHVAKIHVFSSGCGLGPDPVISDRYRIWCVRGPMTAVAINVPSSLVIADGALLVRHVDKMTRRMKRYDCSYIPHWFNFQEYPRIENICESLGIHFISPLADPRTIVAEIGESNLLIAEAMHGAIVADAIRTPWIAATTHFGVNEFKWKDWMMALGINSEIERIDGLVYHRRFVDCLSSPSRLPHRVLRHVGSTLRLMMQSRLNEKLVSRGLLRLSKREGMLSGDGIIATKTDQLMERFAEFVGVTRLPQGG